MVGFWIGLCGLVLVDFDGFVSLRVSDVSFDLAFTAFVFQFKYMNRRESSGQKKAFGLARVLGIVHDYSSRPILPLFTAEITLFKSPSKI